MRNLINMYHKLSEEQLENFDSLYIIHQFFKQNKNNNHLELTDSEIEILLKKINECLKVSNIKTEEIISRMYEIINGVDITICDIEGLELEELVELLGENESDFKSISPKKDIIFAISYKNYYCFLIRYEKKYVIVCIDETGNQFEKVFKDITELGSYIVEKFLNDKRKGIL